MDGKKASLERRESLIERIGILRKKNREPILATLAVFPSKPSLSYIKSRAKVFKYVGIKTETLIFEDQKDTTITDEKLIGIINKWNEDKGISGIMVEMPLPDSMNTFKVLSAISPFKDVDCLNPLSLGYLVYGKPLFLPATPMGVLFLFEKYNIDLVSKNVVIIGRGRTVGRPLSIILSSRNKKYGNATVTLCHSRTFNIPYISSRADILITAMGQPEKIDHTYIKENAVVVDAGINVVKDGDKKKIVGDVDFEKVKDKVYAITPVPGGVGPMTITALMENIVLSLERLYE